MDIYLLSTFIILCLILLIVILLKFFYKPKTNTSNTSNTSNNSNVFKNKYADISYWGPAKDVTGGTRNKCGVYTFAGNISGTIATPGVPNLGNGTINQCVSDFNIPNQTCYGPTAITNNACIDVDQVAAKQQIRECVGKGTDSLGCRNYNGTKIPVGDSALFYISCTAPQCTTSLSSIALNYNYNPDINVILNTAKCLYYDGTNVRGSRCDLSFGQLWRVDKAKISSSSSLIRDPKGNYASFFNRIYNLCLTPVVSKPSDGTLVGLSTCGNGGSNFPWLLFPQTSLPAYDSFPISIAPQQIVWAPKPVKIDSDPALISFLKSNPLSIVLNSNGITELRPFARNSNTQSNYSAQYLDYTLFNTILQNSNLFKF
jgi:hypothetical protein